MAGRKRNRDEKEKQWVEALLTTELFDVCAIHEKLRKNERKIFCLDCHGVFCKYCFESHSCSNRHLTIYKNSHQNVVYVSETKKYFDCSRIQTYKINGEQSVHLNPKPSTKNPVHGDANPLTKTKSGRPCEVCGKSMNDKHNRYCSIACKVTSGASCTPKRKTAAPSSLSEDGILLHMPNKETSGGYNEMEEESVITKTALEADDGEDETEEERAASVLTRTASEADGGVEETEEERAARELTAASSSGSFRNPSRRRKGNPRRSPLF